MISAARESLWRLEHAYILSPGRHECGNTKYDGKHYISKAITSEILKTLYFHRDRKRGSGKAKIQSKKVSGNAHGNPYGPLNTRKHTSGNL